jgi:hypothetical protein
MCCGRANPRNFSAARAFRQWHLDMTSLFVLLAGVTQAMPATAQGGPETPPAAGGGPAGGGPETPFRGGPDILPLVPGGGFGFPNPLNPPTAVNNAAPPVAAIAPTSPLGLPPLGFGVVPLQANDPTAPAYLIRPYAYVSETFTDNVHQVHAPRDAAAYTNLAPGLSISADTPRLQAVLSGNLNTYFYIPTSNLDQVSGSLYANGFGTVVPATLFVNLSSTVTQSSTLPGFGFQNLSRVPTNQQTQVYSTTVSPFLRKSYDGLVDTQLQYTFNATNYGGNTTAVATPLTAPTNLASSISNEGTFIAATGPDLSSKLSSRLTLDASNYNSGSTNQNSQASAFTDFEYRIAPQAAALARVGYQNIQYPHASAATFVGPTWLVGGAIGTYSIGTYGSGPGYIALEYGRQQGVYGFSGSARYNITPTMLFTANLSQGVSSPGQDIGSTLGTSTLDPYGSIVDVYSGLPVTFYSSGLGLTNNPYRQHVLNLGVTEAIGLNSYSLYGYFANQQSLAPTTSALTTPTTSAPTKSAGVNFTWSRDIRPDLNGYASLGYFNSSNVITRTGGTPVSTQNSLTAYIGVNYSLAQNLTGSIFYSFYYQPNGNGFGGTVGRGADVVVNQLTFQLSKTF